MKLRIKNNSDRDDFIEKVKGIDVKSAYRAEFTKIRRPRSLNQNSYIWLCLAIAQDETGLDKGVYYQHYLNKFPTFEAVEVFGELQVYPLTSSHFDSKQMSTFLDKVRLDLGENGIETPDADDRRLEDIFLDMQQKGIL